MGKQYENDLAKEIHRATASRIRSYRCGYSGSNAMPQPDILVTTDNGNHALEVKGRITSNNLYVYAEDLQQLAECENGYTTAHLAVTFSGRAPIVIRYFDRIPELEDGSVAEKLQKSAPEGIGTSVTDAGSLRIDKPSTDDWESAQAMEGSGDRAQAIAVLKQLGVAVLRNRQGRLLSEQSSAGRLRNDGDV